MGGEGEVSEEEAPFITSERGNSGKEKRHSLEEGGQTLLFSRLKTKKVASTRKPKKKRKGKSKTGGEDQFLSLGGKDSPIGGGSKYLLYCDEKREK